MRAAGRAPRALAAIGIAVWSAGMLGAFLWRFPVPVDLRQALALCRDAATAVVMLGAAALAGRRLLRAFRLDAVLPAPADRLLFSAALGYGAAGLLAFAAARLGALRPWPWAAGAALLWAACRRDAAALDADLRRVGRPAAGDPVRMALAAALALAMGLMTMEALAPPTAYDALRYHLRLPRLHAEAGRWVDVGYDFGAAFPQNVDMLFSLAFAFGAPGAAALTHLLLGWLALGAAGRLASEMAGPEAALPAAAIFYTMPVVAINSAWAYVDLGLALFTLLALRAARAWWQQPDPRWIVLAGACAGLGLGTRYTGAASLLVLGAAFAARAVEGGRLRPRRLAAVALFVAVGLGLAAPWLGRNALERGNPLYPFASSIFGAPAGDTYRAERHAADLDRPEVPRGSAVDVLLLPWRFTMTPWVRDEMVGPALLVAIPIAALSPAPGTGWLLSAAAGYGGIWLLQSPQVRLFLHGLGMLAAIAAAAWTRLRRQGGAAAAAASAGMLLAIGASLGNLAVIQRALSDPFPVVAAMEDRGHYLRRNIEGHAAIEFINRELPPDARVLFVGEIFGYYCQRDHVLGSKFDRAPLVDWIAGSPDLPAFLARLRAERITHLLYSRVQLRKFARPPGTYLDWPDDRSRAIYRDFMTRHLEPLYEDEDAIVARVVPQPLRAAP
jgi:hypothetical protein